MNHNIYRLLLALPTLSLFIIGCSHTPTPDRKAELESWLPEYITSDLRHRVPPPTHDVRVGNVWLDRDRIICSRVALVEESDGHYTGEAFFISGGHPKLDVVDEGKNVQFTLETVNVPVTVRIPPSD